MENMEVEAVRHLSFLQRWRMGATIQNAKRIAKQLKAEGLLADSREERARQIADELCVEAPGEAEVCAVEFGTWEEFFQALAAFIEKILPLIMLFL